MFRLTQLGISPPLFGPVTFHEGVNIVMGEKWDDEASQGKKTNGVGKSLFVDFLHFALLRKHTDTRIPLIPIDEFPDDFEVRLNLRIHNEPFTITRSRFEPEHPRIARGDNDEITFGTLDEANAYLSEILFQGQPHAGQLSIRQLLSLLMRHERSEFADPLRPHKIGKNIPPELEPHLYLMGIDLSVYRELRGTIERIDSQQKALRAIKEDLTSRGKKRLSDIPKELNEEQVSVEKIDAALKTLEAEPAFAEIESELVEIEAELRTLRAERKGIAYKIQQIDSIPTPERIKMDDLAIVYNRVKSGLGDLVQKSLEQAVAFKKEIESFQSRLRQEEYQRLKAEYQELSGKIHTLSRKHSERVKVIDKKGVLQELQTGLEEAVSRKSDYNRKASLLEFYNEGVTQKEQLAADRAKLIVDLRKLLLSYEDLRKSLNATFLRIHQRVMESSGASFSFELNDKPTVKYPLSIRADIDDSGSHGIDHMAVFIYDCTLLFNERTHQFHPGFLLHDNIFAVDNDSLVQSLNYLHEEFEGGATFQYVVTLNRDKIEAEERRKAIKLNVDKAKILTLTKKKPLLGKRFRQKDAKDD
ncbi:MAG: DUF2326 domain-containing protein [Verrucomicrobiales bacterium]